MKNLLQHKLDTMTPADHDQIIIRWTERLVQAAKNDDIKSMLAFQRMIIKYQRLKSELVKYNLFKSEHQSLLDWFKSPQFGDSSKKLALDELDHLMKSYKEAAWGYGKIARIDTTDQIGDNGLDIIRGQYVRS